MTPDSSQMAAPIDHYENFPVASWLCPAHLRPPITAIYHFARTADDLADEGDASPDERLAALRDYRKALEGACQKSLQPDSHWPHIFGPLAHAIAKFALPTQLLHALLDAFEQDVRMTQAGATYPDGQALLSYCSRSANPVGRLLLHLYQVQDARALQQSDAVCTALQLINFWQDPSVDLPRGRNYFPDDWCASTGFDPTRYMRAQAPVSKVDNDGAAEHVHQSASAMMATCAQDARARMHEGQPLAKRLPGRAGWELRLVVQGALRVLDKIDALGPQVLRERPRLRAWDAPIVLWRALRM